MSVNSVSSSNSISSLDPLLSIQTQTDVSSTSGAATKSSISKFGSLMNELQQLSQSDPDKFKEVTASIAQTLQSDASNATGNQAQFLNQLADKFQQASQTGSMSSLQPPASASGHHGHHRHVQSYSSGQSEQSSAPSGTQSQTDIAQIIQNALQDVSG